MRCPQLRPATISCRQTMAISKRSGGVAAGIGTAVGIGTVADIGIAVGGVGEHLHDRSVRPNVSPQACDACP
jgi:hypothetical protein